MAHGEGSPRAAGGHAEAAARGDAERTRREVEAAIPAFDAATQMVVRAVLLDGRAEDEVAAVLGVTPWSVARKLARFRAALLRPLAVALAAGALSGCGTVGPRGAAEEPAAPRERLAAASAPATEGERRAAEPPPRATASLAPAAAPAPAARADDDEISPGLPAPPAEQTVPAPDPWRPSPGAAAPPVVADVWPDKGPASGGDRVVIRGQGLRPAQVLFGLAPARILSAAEGEVVVAAPPGPAGAVSLALTNGDGEYVVLPAAFRYYD